jgi:tetratricopeptide (TPR) repeat protein
MNARVLLSAVLAAVVAAAGVSYVIRERAEKAAPRPIDPEVLERIADRLSAIEGEMAKNRASHDTAANRLRALEERMTAREAEPIERDASRARPATERGADASAETAAAAGSSKPLPPLTLEDALARLDDPKLTGTAREMFWQELRERKMLDGVIAEMEKRAKANKSDADLQTQLAEVYLQKIQEVGQGPLAGVYATKADKAYDAALNINPEHWDARFGKAVSLSFWPPALGKQPLAIKEFETLLEQQSRQATRSDFAQTYLFLGNLYLQTGAGAKALETWNKGLAAFPDNEALKAQVAAAAK